MVPSFTRGQNLIRLGTGHHSWGDKGLSRAYRETSMGCVETPRKTKIKHPVFISKEFEVKIKRTRAEHVRILHC